MQGNRLGELWGAGLIQVDVWIKNVDQMLGFNARNIDIHMQYMHVPNLTFSFRQIQSSDQVECIFGPW